MLKTISKATQQNWQRLHTDVLGRLTKRANKILSTRRIVTTGYTDSSVAKQLLMLVNDNTHPVCDVIYSLCCSCLQYHSLWEKPHVQQAFSAFSYHALNDINVPEKIWDNDDDILGFVYQSLLTEGERISSGCYYTSLSVVNDMLNGLEVTPGETFLDPCCGSGAFLLQVKTADPNCLYGIDKDPVAVMIATTNILVKYKEVVFIPHVLCADFLAEDFHLPSSVFHLSSVDYVYTNPPWGTDKENFFYEYSSIFKTNERSSLFLIRSLSYMKPTGHLGFLLPTSLLKIGKHRLLRQFISNHAGITRITLYNTCFNGVFTNCFSIMLTSSKTENQQYVLKRDGESYDVLLSDDDKRMGNILFMPMNAIDKAVVHKMESFRHDDLSHSQWALGIVTGDNRRRVSQRANKYSEPVITGRDVESYSIHQPSTYMRYVRQAFQQSAPEILYRAKEKLVYRFIASYPIVAYDSGQRLCLNSANILIPSVEGVSILSVMALLNSSLYRYYYQLHFTDLKVLKGNLCKLPFPLLKPEEDARLKYLSEEIVNHGVTQEKVDEINSFVFKLFDLNDAEIEHVKRQVTSRSTKSNLNTNEE